MDDRKRLAAQVAVGATLGLFGAAAGFVAVTVLFGVLTGGNLAGLGGIFIGLPLGGIGGAVLGVKAVGP